MSTDGNKISVIVPCYNYGWIIAETLDSVIQQSHDNWECIVIDDGSTDNTRLVVEEYAKRDKRFRYVYQANAGLSAARNKGLEVSTGDYIQFLDADDLIHNNKLAAQISFLNNHPTIDIIFGDVRYFLHDNPGLISRSIDMSDQVWMQDVPEYGEGLVERTLLHNIMVVNAPLVRRNVIDKVGLFKTELKSMEDWDYWLRCALSNIRMAYFDKEECMAYVRVHSTSMSQNNRRMLNYQLLVRRNLIEKLRNLNYNRAIEINNRMINECEKYLAIIYMKDDNVLSGIALFFKLAVKTGDYKYYLKSIPYWLKCRLMKNVN